MTNTNELIVSDVAKVDLVEELKNPNAKMYCSLTDDGTRASKVAIYNAINSADESLGDHIGEVLEVVNVVAHPIVITDEHTGEEKEVLRTVLVTKEGKTYVAVSQGVTSALAKIFHIIGTPDNGAWENEPVAMRVKQVKTRNGNNKVNTLELV